MTYTPDPALFQQLVVGGATRTVDCTAHGGAWVTAAHTQGGTILNGRKIRLASDEPIPDPRSPGLNVAQVDAAIYKLTDGRVNLDTPPASTLTRASVKSLIIDGRWANVAVNRGVLVDRGYGGSNGFRGPHDVCLHARPIDNEPVIGDPLVPHYTPCTWDTVLDAMSAVSAGDWLFASFTRDLTPDYRVSIKPRPGFRAVQFVHYLLDANGRIAHRRTQATSGVSEPSSPPKYHSGSNGIKGRTLTQITAGKFKGLWVSSKWAHEVIP